MRDPLVDRLARRREAGELRLALATPQQIGRRNRPASLRLRQRPLYDGPRHALRPAFLAFAFHVFEAAIYDRCGRRQLALRLRSGRAAATMIVAGAFIVATPPAAVVTL